MREIWVPLKDYPGYDVSNYGYVRKEGFGQLAMSTTHDGTVKVHLNVDGQQITRSVRRLVAEEFCEKPDERCDTVITLDGNPSSNYYTNLAWRPRWFAWEYARQFHTPVPDKYHILVRNCRTGEMYRTVMEAGVREGLLWSQIYTSCLEHRMVYPTTDIFEVV